jgi:hypothetical protein
MEREHFESRIMHLRHLLRRGGTKLPICPYIRYPETAKLLRCALRPIITRVPPLKQKQCGQSWWHWQDTGVRVLSAAQRGCLPQLRTQFRYSFRRFVLHRRAPQFTPATNMPLVCSSSQQLVVAESPVWGLSQLQLQTYRMGIWMDGSYHTRCHLGILYLVSTVKQSGVEV